MTWTKVAVALAAAAVLPLVAAETAGAAQPAAAHHTSFTVRTAPERVLQGRVDAQLRRAPGGVQVGRNVVSYDHGKAEAVISPPEAVDGLIPNNTGPCPSGYFCVWTGTSQQGSRYQWQSEGVNQNFAAYGVGYFYSMYNNRSHRMYLDQGQNAGGSTQCYSPGTYVSSLGPWYDHAGSFYLSPYSTC